MRQALAGRLVERLVTALPPRRAYGVASALSGAFLRGKTKRLLADTKALFPDRDDAWVRDAVRRQRRHRAWVALDKYMVTRLTGDEVVAMHDPESVARVSALADEALAGGRGAVVYTLHYGRPAWAPFLFSHLGYPYVGLMRGTSDTGLQRHHTAAARATGAELVEAGDLSSGVHLLRGLKEGKFLFVLIDGRMTQKATAVEFLGRRVPFSLGFAQLARRANARLMAGVTRTGGDPMSLGVDARWVDLPDEELSPEELGRRLVAPLEEMVLGDVGQYYGINRLFRRARLLDKPDI